MTVTIDCDFPGGNIVVEKIDGNDVFIHQDLRDTQGDWFYWCFRVKGAQRRTLRFHFTKSNVIGVRGPAVSLDQGMTWEWLGTGCVQDKSFSYAFNQENGDVRFGLGMSYLQSHLNMFLATVKGYPNLKVDTLCRSKKARNVERLHIGCLDQTPKYRAVLTSRHHCCEMMATYALEGVVEFILTDMDQGKWLLENVEFLVVPFMDKDGVEEGDQGKSRKPHDHNRDYGPYAIYPEVQAFMSLVPKWSQGLLRLGIDLHCPYIRGQYHEFIYQVGSQKPENWEQQKCLGDILESVRQGPLPYHCADNLPFGQDWNKGSSYSQGTSCSRWVLKQPGVKLATAFEIPYAKAREGEVNQATAKQFGFDLARATAVYLKASVE